MADQASSKLDDTLTLRIKIDDQIYDVPLRHGLKLGTDAESVEVFIGPDGPSRRRFLAPIVQEDAGVLTLFSFDHQKPIILPNGQETMFLRLHHGTKFNISIAQFECIGPGLETPKVQSIDSLQSDEQCARHSCPRCRQHLVDCPDAKFCPHCGAPLPDNCPAWPSLEPMPQKMLRASRLRWILPRFLYRYRVNDPLYSSRQTSVLAYINTLFNIGLRLEAGTNNDPNFREADRYYEKAASLGNLPARVRLALKQKRE